MKKVFADEEILGRSERMEKNWETWKEQNMKYKKMTRKY